MKDVNGGYWGFVIVISAFMIQLISFGISLSFGVYNIELLEINQDAFAVSLIAAINAGVFLGSGPIASFLMNRMCHRNVVFIGAAITTASLLCMPFLPSLGYVYAIYGVITGLGFSLVYIPSHVLTGLYFIKHQSLATGIAQSGLGMGLTVFPIIVGVLIQEYTWRPSFFILAGFALNLFVFASLLRPIPKREKSLERLNDFPDKWKRNNHCSLFLNVRFDVYCFTNLLWNMGFNNIISFGPDYLTTIGYTSIESATMFTAFGLCTFLGSVLIGVLGTLPCSNRLVLYAAVCLLAGISVCCFPLVSTRVTVVIDLCGQGLGYGGILGLLVVLTSDFVGIERLGDAVGFLMFVNGLGCFAGPPVAGALKNKLGTYTTGFYIAGSFILGSFVIMVTMLTVLKLCHKDATVKSTFDSWQMEEPDQDRKKEITRL